MASTSNKRKCLKLSDKVKIIDEVALGVGVTQLAKKYGVSKATICKIKRLKTQILRKTCDTLGGPGNRRTLKSAKAPRMEYSLYKWFVKQREMNVTITGEMIKERAKLLNGKLKETENFTASDGWLQRFKRRHGIRLLSISGETLSAQPHVIQPFKEKLLEKIKNPNIVCTPADVSGWNEDKQMDVVKEEDYENNENPPIEVKSEVTDAQAVEIFNQALDWAEGKEVKYTDILVLQKLRALAMESNAGCK